jgi:hypothetical protein
MVGCSDKEELKTVAAAKVEQITAELQTASSSDPKAFDPVEKIKSGFIHFKKEKYEYVIVTLFLLLQFFWYMLNTHRSS